MSDIGITALGALPNLEVLILDEIDGVTDLTLSGFVNLHELHCQNCDDIRDQGIVTLIETAPNLRYLNLFNTNVTAAVLRTADAITKLRTNNLKLHIVVGSITLQHWVVREPSPLLEIEAKYATVSDISDGFLYDDDDDIDPEDIWDLGVDDFDEYDDINDMDEFDYNGENPFYLF